MKRLLALTALAVLSACEVTTASNNVFTVYSDGGGILDVYDDHVRRLNEAGSEVRIMGWCASACTMYLGAKNVCVHPTKAFLEFHGSIPILGTKAEGDAMMAKHYKPKLRKWYYAKPAKLQLLAAGLTGQELHDRFGYRLCD